jgi:AcrR family transcriptional regulator
MSLVEIMPVNDLIFSDSQPTRSDAAKNRALILETAQRLFVERGVENVTMTDIADRAGVGKGTLYRHFDNKTLLCQALLDEDQRSLQDRTLEQMRNHDEPLDNLRWFLAEALQFVERNRPLLCVSSAAIPTLNFPAHWWWRQTIRGLLGQVNPTGDLDYMSDLLYVMLDVHTVSFLRLSRGYSLEQLTESLFITLDKITA